MAPSYGITSVLGQAAPATICVNSNPPASRRPSAALLTAVIVATLLFPGTAHGRDGVVYFGGTVGYFDMLGDSGPAGTYFQGMSFGARAGIFRSSDLAYSAAVGIDAGLAGESFDGWYLQLPSAQVGFGVGGQLTMLFLQAGLAPVGIDGFSDDVVFSVLNPRVGLAFQYQPGDWVFRVEAQVEQMFRLADELDVTSLHFRVTLGRSVSRF